MDEDDTLSWEYCKFANFYLPRLKISKYVISSEIYLLYISTIVGFIKTRLYIDYQCTIQHIWMSWTNHVHKKCM